MTIYVGPTAETFHLYRKILFRDSVYFKAAFTRDNHEGSESKLSMPEDDVDIFRIYQTWLNTGDLRYNFDGEIWWLRLARLWIFADKVSSHRLKNRTIDSFFDIVDKNKNMVFADAWITHYIFEHTSPLSPLRRLLSRLFFHLKPSRDDLASYPPVFLAEVLGRARFHEPTWSAVAKVQSALVQKHRRSDLHMDCSLECCAKKNMAAEKRLKTEDR